MTPHESMPFVSIIIVNFNGLHYLQECFNSLKNLDYPEDCFEVILVDNGSKDGSVEYVESYCNWVKILKLDKNYGFCKPNNDGANIAKGEYIVLLNNDTIVSKQWLSELVKSAMTEKDIVCCASKILYYNERSVINAAGGKLTLIGGGFYRGYGEKDSNKYNKREYVGFGCGAGVLVRKDFFQYVGGLDEEYFASVEEMDLGWKSWLFGFKVLYVPSAVMYHKESGTFGEKGMIQPIKVYLATRNRLYTIIKNLENYNVFRSLIMCICFDSYRFLSYSSSRNFNSAKSVIYAYKDFIINFNKMKAKRNFVQSNRKISDSQLIRCGAMATLKECFLECFAKKA